MSCTFQTWNSTKNNSFHQEFDSLVTYLRWLGHFTYLTPQWHQFILQNSHLKCHLQMWSAKSRTMLCNWQMWRQEMFPDKVFPSHIVSKIFLATLHLSTSSALIMGYRMGTSSELCYRGALNPSRNSQRVFTQTGIILAELNCSSPGWSFRKCIEVKRMDRSTLNSESIHAINWHQHNPHCPNITLRKFLTRSGS